MGTSTPFGGPKGNSPLVPSWLDNDNDNPFPSTDDSGTTQADDNSEADEITQSLPIPPPANSERFQTARNNLTRFAQSGGSDKASLGRAISNYISKGAGGSKKASKRMGSSRSAASNLVNVLSSIASNGVEQTLKSFSLDNLIDKPIQEIFLGLSDVICPDGGSVDEGIARDAFIETIVQLAEDGITDFDSLGNEQIETVFEIYTTNAIEARICNDIAMKLITMPKSAKIAEAVQRQLHDFIRGAVSDAIMNQEYKVTTIDTTRSLGFVDSVYEQAFSILKSISDLAGDK